MNNPNFIEQEYIKHKSYKTYTEDLLHTLVLFDKVKEWADLVKILTRLINVLQKYEQIPIIPHKILVSRRLAQCLDPNLPNGVHTKAIETFDVILKKIGEHGLSLDLDLYSSFLPFFQFAATAIKPQILTLFEKYFLPLKMKLIPGISGFLLGLLPGVEEENSEIYPKTVKILNTLEKNVGTSAMFLALWKCLLAGDSCRFATLHYLTEHLPKEIHKDEVPLYFPHITHLVVPALSKGLHDGNLLAERSALDVVEKFFPINASWIDKKSLENLAKDVLLCLLRREMSLYRRIFSWLSGSEAQKEQHSKDEITKENNYFSKYGKPLVISSLHVLFTEVLNNPSNENFSLPFKVLISLLEKEDVGDTIIEHILLDVFQTFYFFKDNLSYASKVFNYVDEIFKGVSNELFWPFLQELLIKEWPSDVEMTQEKSIILIDSLIDILPLKEEEIQFQYLPNLIHQLLVVSEMAIKKDQIARMIQALQLAYKIFGKMQRLKSPQVSSETIQEDFLVKPSSKCEDLFVFFVNTYISQTNHSQTVENFVAFDLLCSLLLSLETSFKLQSRLDMSLSREEGEEIPFRTPDERDIPSWLKTNLKTPWIESTFICCSSELSPICCIAMKMLLDILGDSNSVVSYELRNQFGSSQYKMLANRLWELLNPKIRAVHYQAADLFLILNSFDEKNCQEVIAEALTNQSTDKRVANYQKFALLWRLIGERNSDPTSRPFSSSLFLMLDSLTDEQSIIRLVGSQFVADSISRAERILDPLLIVLLDFSTLRKINVYQKKYDTRRIQHVLKILKKLIECDFELFMQHVSKKQISKDILTLADNIDINLNDNSQNFQINTYLDILILVGINFIQGQVSETFGPEFKKENENVQIYSTEFLQFLLFKINSPTKAAQINALVQGPIITCLADSVTSGNLVLQVELLGLLRSVLFLDEVGFSSEDIHKNKKENEKKEKSLCEKDLLIQTILSGLDQDSKRGIRIYWLEFATNCLRPQISEKFIIPIIQCLCSLLENLSFDSFYDSIGSKEVLVLLKSLQIFFSFIFQVSKISNLKEISKNNNNRNTLERTPSNFFFSLGSEVMKTFFFQQEQENLNVTSSKDAPLTEAGRKILKLLPEVLSCLLKLWKGKQDSKTKSTSQTNLQSINNNPQNNFQNLTSPLLRKHSIGNSKTSTMKTNTMNSNNSDDFSESGSLKGWNSVNLDTITQRFYEQSASFEGELHNKYAIQDQALHMMEPFMKTFPIDFVHSLLKLWDQKTASQNTIVDFLNNLESSTIPKVLQAVLALFKSLHGGGKKNSYSSLKKNRLEKTQNSFTKREGHIFNFLEMFILKQMSVDELSNGWIYLLEILRESLDSVRPDSGPKMLRILEIFLKKAPQIIDKKFKREIQDIVQKLIEQNITLLARGNLNFENNFDDFTLKDALLNQKPLENSPFIYRNLMILSQNVTSVVNTLFEEDRAITIFSTMFHGTLPLLKYKSEQNQIQAVAALKLIISLAEYPYTIRVWKNDINYIFFEKDFFSNSPLILQLWAVVINNFMNQDKQAFFEFIKSLTKTLNSQPGLLTNREDDVQNKAKNIKQLSFILYSGKFDQYEKNIRQIQCLLVEALKINNAPQIYITVFFCLKILLLRFNPKILTNFWPLIISELIRVFSENSGEKKSPLLYEACKFLDLVLVLDFEEIYFYQWMFFSEIISEKTENEFIPYLKRVSPNCSPVIEPPKIIPEGNKRPILPNQIEISKNEKFKNDNQKTVSFNLVEWHEKAFFNSLSTRKIDYEFIEQSLLEEFSLKY